MARKHTTESDLVASSSAAAAAAREKVAARPKHSMSTAEAPKTPARVTEPEAPSAASTASVEPSRAEIARLAYTYWVERGYTAGSPDEDWLRAERELRAQAQVGA